MHVTEHNIAVSMFVLLFAQEQEVEFAQQLSSKRSLASPSWAPFHAAGSFLHLLPWLLGQLEL